MKRKISNLKWGVVAFAMSLPLFSNASGIESAAQQFSSTANTVKSYFQTGLLAVAIICASIGLVGALGKTNVEGEQASKNFIKWFIGAALFGIGWGLMATIFR